MALGAGDKESTGSGRTVGVLDNACYVTQRMQRRREGAGSSIGAALAYCCVDRQIEPSIMLTTNVTIIMSSPKRTGRR